MSQNYGSSRRPQGASTITQQVAKNFLLTNEVSVTRKIKEALLALRIERTYSKDKILELYLNEIYLGLGAYGVAAASLLYFDKSVHELTIAEAAYLAALPKGPNNYNPFRRRDEAIARRNYVIDRMVEDGFITADAGDKAKKEPLDVTVRPTGAHTFAAEYFAEEVRRYIFENYGEKKLYEGGLSVRTTLDPKMQVLARKTMINGLVNFDEKQGWRGPVTKIDIDGDWGVKLADVKSLSDIDPWRLAVVLEVNDQSARIGLQPPRDPGGAVVKEREVGIMPLEGVKWAKPAGRPAKPTSASARCLRPATWSMSSRWQGAGPVPAAPGAGNLRRHGGDGPAYRPRAGDGRRLLLRPEPVQPRHPGAAAAGLVVQADRLCRRDRQRLHALDHRARRADRNRHRPGGGGIWKPENYGGKFYGPSTLRFGLELSRNVMTVRLAQDIGMPLIAEYAKRFGVYDDLPPYLSYALGAGETTVMRMVTAYSMLDNGGRRVKPTLIDRIQDRYGHTIYKHDQRECLGCDADNWHNQPEPTLIDHREQVIDPMTAYQITSMMEGVVQRGTATVVRDVGKPIAGKTGTTNDEKDVWFIGFSPDIVCGVYMGYDKPRHIGAARDRRPSGGADRARFPQGRARRQAADPVPRAARHQAHPRRCQDRHARRPGRHHTSSSKPSSPAPRRRTIIRSSAPTADVSGRPLPVSPDADRAIRTGTGGLY